MIRHSRPFCVAKAGKVFSEEQVETWQGQDWKGKKPGSIWIVRRGYNCRHHFLAVDPEWVPEGEIKVQKWKEE